MRIGILSNPLLFQRDAAVQCQIRASVRALQALRVVRGVSVSVTLLDGDPAQVEKYDLIHAFSAGGSDRQCIVAASTRRIPLVLSPLLPHCNWRAGGPARADDVRPASAGCAPSEHADTAWALHKADLILALGHGDQAAIASGFRIDASRVQVLAAGVEPAWFSADGALFRLRTGLHGRFVLMDAPLCPWHDQLGLARALAGTGVTLVLLGSVRACDQAYASVLRHTAGVVCLDGLRTDPSLMASAYAAASVLVLPCRRDGSLRTMLAALACGTPVVASAAAAIPCAVGTDAVRQVAVADAPARHCQVLALLACTPPGESVRTLVRPFTWERAAQQLAAVYLALARHRMAIA